MQCGRAFLCRTQADIAGDKGLAARRVREVPEAEQDQIDPAADIGIGEAATAFSSIERINAALDEPD